MPELDSTLVWAALIVLVAAATSGLAGFGFSVLSVSPLLMLYDPATVITINKLLTLGTTWIVLVGTWQAISWPHLRRLVPPAIAGLFLGVVVLTSANPGAIKLAVGVTVILFAMLLLSGRIQHLPERRWMAPVTGAISGVLSTSTGTSGPPLVLFFSVVGLPVAVFRATSVMYFVCLDVIGFPALAASGVITRSDLMLSLILAPAALLGRWIGARLVPYVTPIAFRRVVLVLLMVTGGLAIATVLASG